MRTAAALATVATLTAVLLVVGCGSPGGGAPPQAPAPGAQTPAPAATPAREADRRPLVVFLGDSLTAGLGVAEDQAYPALVGERLAAEGHPARVVNAGVSGDTSAGGVSRLDWILSQHPDVVVVGLGANDGLRGLPLDSTEANLREIVRRVQASGARAILLGMKIPPSYGPDYFEGFEAMYPKIAHDLHVPLVPFLLAGVAARPALNQADRIHPNAKGHEIVAKTVFPYVEKAVEAVEEGKG